MQSPIMHPFHQHQGDFMNEAIHIIKKRRSVRKFESKPVSDEIIRDILDCARLAPTANNLQPWLFGAITKPHLKSQLADFADYGKFIKDCAVCFAVFADSTKKYFLEDGCAATENILLACTAHGICSCWVAGHKKRLCRRCAKAIECFGAVYSNFAYSGRVFG